MDTLIGIATKDFVVMACDASQLRSIMVVKEFAEDKLLRAFATPPPCHLFMTNARMRVRVCVDSALM